MADSDLTLAETHRLASRTEERLEELYRLLSLEREARADERHEFRSENSKITNVIQETQVSLISRTSQHEERLTQLVALNQLAIQQAQTIGELRESLRGMQSNSLRIDSIIAQVANVTTRLEMVQNLGGKSMSMALGAVLTIGTSTIVGILVWALTRSTH